MSPGPLDHSAAVTQLDRSIAEHGMPRSAAAIQRTLIEAYLRPDARWASGRCSAAASRSSDPVLALPPREGVSEPGHARQEEEDEAEAA